MGKWRCPKGIGCGVGAVGLRNESGNTLSCARYDDVLVLKRVHERIGEKSSHSLIDRMMCRPHSFSPLREQARL